MFVTIINGIIWLSCLAEQSQDKAAFLLVIVIGVTVDAEEDIARLGVSRGSHRRVQIG